MGHDKLNRIVLEVQKKISELLHWSSKKNQERSSVYGTVSYSQEGEDLILKRIFEGQAEGFYVDVGAHHPIRFSNTFLFYQSGWCGINIDAMPGSMKLFRELRARDINLEVGVSNNKSETCFFCFNEPALNTFSREQAELKDGYKNFRVVKKEHIKVELLNDILYQYLPKGQRIDFLNIDVEGKDLDVLESLDLERYEPKVIVVEDAFSELSQVHDSQIFKYLNDHGYEPMAKTYNSWIYRLI